MSRAAQARAEIQERSAPPGVGDLVSTPAAMRPRGFDQRVEQSRLKQGRIAHVQDLMMRDQWVAGVTGERLMAIWWPHLDPHKQRERMKDVTSAADNRVALAFDRAEIARNQHARLETAQRICLEERRFALLPKLMQVQQRLAGIAVPGHEHYHAGDHSEQTTIQIVAVGAEPKEVVTNPAMRALVRGRQPRIVEAPPVQSAQAVEEKQK